MTIKEDNNKKQQQTQTDDTFAVAVYDHLLIKDKETNKVILNRRG